MFYSDGQNVTEIDAIRIFNDHDERYDGVGEYEVEVIDFPRFINLDVDEDYRFPMPPMVPPNTPPGFGPGPGYGPSNPGGPGSNQGPPGPPPSFTPSQQSAQKSTSGGTAKFVSPGTLRPCMFRYVYIWQTNGRSYWAYLVFIDNRSVAGWRWEGFRWRWFGLDLRFIQSFTCF